MPAFRTTAPIKPSPTIYHNYSEMPSDFALNANLAARGKSVPGVERTASSRSRLSKVKERFFLLPPQDAKPMGRVAHHYNVSAKRHNVLVEAVYNSKIQQDGDEGTCTLDLERGIMDKI